VTEASSSWNWPGSNDPPWNASVPGQNTVLHNFFTLAELGQYALTGVGIVGRWALALGGGFGTIAGPLTLTALGYAGGFGSPGGISGPGLGGFINVASSVSAVSLMLQHSSHNHYQ
jgi:hypothetical protein